MSEPFRQPYAPPLAVPLRQPFTEGCLARVYAPRARRPFPSPIPIPHVFGSVSFIHQTEPREADE